MNYLIALILLFVLIKGCIDWVKIYTYYELSSKEISDYPTKIKHKNRKLFEVRYKIYYIKYSPFTFFWIPIYIEYRMLQTKHFTEYFQTKELAQEYINEYHKNYL